MVSAFDEHWAEEASREIVDVLDKIAKHDDLQGTSDAWTREILYDVANLGGGKRDKQGKGIWVCAGRVGTDVADGGEWLFDLCWLEYARQERGAPLISIPLAMEVEWGNAGDIYDDFEKLMVSRALLRVMVFQDSPKMSTQKLCEKLRDLVQGFEGTQLTDHYLLSGYENAKNKFRHWHLKQNQVTECVKH